MNQSWMSDRAIWIRLVMAVVLVGYLAIITLTHFIALPLQLEVPLVLTGWLFLPVLYVWSRLLRLDMSRRAQPRVKELLRPWALTAGFGALAGVVLFLAIGWDAPSFCHGPVPLNCVKGYHWSVESGHYYHTIFEGPPEEISQNRYIQEAGFFLRSAAAFGVFALCLGWVAAGGLRAPSKAADSRLA
jgi:hypothetical protein